MNNLMNLNYENNPIRIITDDNNEPWFVAKDVCDVLGINDYHQVLERLDVDERGRYEIPTPGGIQLAKCINESGLYSLILRSNKEEAKPFQRWVRKEVLPSINKHGAYMTPDTLEKAIGDPDFAIGILTALKDEKNKRLVAETKVKELAPKAEFYDMAMDSSRVFNMNQVAKELNIDKGRNGLFKLLRAEGILMSDNLPYQRFIDAKYFVVKETVMRFGSTPTVYLQTFATNKGIEYLLRRFGTKSSQHLFKSN